LDRDTIARRSNSLLLKGGGMRSQCVFLPAILILGCVSTRYKPSLDMQLTEAGAALLAGPVVVLDESGECESVTASRQAGRDPELSITIHRNHTDLPGRGFQCLEPYLYVLTLGFIPADCTNDYDFAVTFDGRSGKRTVERHYTVTHVQGWVSGLLVLLPGWQFGEDEPPCARAFTTVVNEHAGGK
jgi:hypothetical protein